MNSTIPSSTDPSQQHHDNTSITTRKQRICFSDIPTEVLMQIALELPCKDFSRFLQTSRTIYNIVNSHYVWHQRFITRFGQRILADLLEASRAPKNASRPPSRPVSPRFPQDSNTNISNDGSPAIVPQGSPHGFYHNHQDSTSTPSSSTPSSLSPSPTSSASSSPRLRPEDLSGNDSDAKDSPAKKGKEKKVDLRKTTEVSKEQIIQLYIKYSKLIVPAENMDICHMGDRYWKMVQHRDSTFGKLAQLQSVWWMDVAADIRGIPPGQYKVQWRIKVTSDAPIINSEFTAVLFGKDEDKASAAQKKPSIFYKPRNVQEFTERTDTRVRKADRKPFRNLFKQDFTILELPGDLVVEDDYQNVHLQISNHEGWKSGLYIDYVQLVDVKDLPSSRRNSQEISPIAPTSAATSPGGSADEVNNDGEEYYPNPTESIPRQNWLTGTGPINTIFRSRAFRHNQALGSDYFAQLGTVNTSPPESSSTTSQQQQPDPMQEPNAWYKLYAILFVYCLYIFWAS